MLKHSFIQFINDIPKVELHLHIEGTYEPELMFKIAQRNNCKIPYNSSSEIKNAYVFNNLQEFLNIYYTSASTLIYEQDFYELTLAYIEKCASQNIMHTEIFFDPQTHTVRGISFDTVVKGIVNALKDGQKRWGISHKLIMCFLRHLNPSEAMNTLQQALPWKDYIYGVGLDSSEMGFPPSLFVDVFNKARLEGFVCVAHAGEEGPAEYIYEALELLQVARIDHGNNCINDVKLIQRLIDNQVALTMCPLSNKELKVCPDLTQHPLLKLLNQHVNVTVNSDDPAYFGGYMNENFIEIADALSLTRENIIRLMLNAINASFADSERKSWMQNQVMNFSKNYPT